MSYLNQLLHAVRGPSEPTKEYMGDTIKPIAPAAPTTMVSPLRNHINSLTTHRDRILKERADTSAEINRLTQLQYEQTAIIEGLNRAIDTMSMRTQSIPVIEESDFDFTEEDLERVIAA